MSEENTDLPQDEPKTYTQAELDAILEERTKPLKQKVDEFRESNVKFLKDREDLEAVAKAKEEEARAHKEELARNSGKFDEFEQAVNERNRILLEDKQREADLLREKISKRDSIILESKKNSEVSELLSLFRDDDKVVGRKFLNDMIDVSFDESGNLTKMYKDLDGKALSTETLPFQEYLKSNADMKRYMRGVQMDGGGATGSKNISGSATKQNSALQDAVKNKDVNAYIGAALKQNFNKG